MTHPQKAKSLLTRHLQEQLVTVCNEVKQIQKRLHEVVEATAREGDLSLFTELHFGLMLAGELINIADRLMKNLK